jgi:hypothetical protein
MHPKIEDLRKKAYLLYDGLEGVERVNHEVKRFGIKEEKLNQYQIKLVLNNIIKNVFVDKAGIEKTKQLLALEVKAIPGYTNMLDRDEGEKTRITDKINFMAVIVAFVAVLMIALIVGVVYYMMSFEQVSLCHNKPEGDQRDNCYYLVALNDQNASVCENVDSLQRRYSCMAQVAQSTKDIDICMRIPATDNLENIILYDKCISCVAYNLGNFSMCKNLKNPIKIEECRTQIERGYSLNC